VSYVLAVIVGLVVLFFGLRVWFRFANARAEESLREEIRAYVTKRGGTVTFDNQNGMTVEGPLGKGYEKLTALRIMLGSAKDRPLTIGFALRSYIPDRFDDIFEESAKKRLEEATGSIDALSVDELREKLRISIVSTRTTSTNLATCARPIAEGYEARVVLDGFDLSGIPKLARARLEEDDAALFDKALAKTLGGPPDVARGEVEGHAWLAAPDRIFGVKKLVIAVVGNKLVWIPVQPADASNALAEIAGQSLESGTLKGVLFGWDGQALTRLSMATHTIKGPTTPDFTIELPPAYREAFGLTADAHGGVGVSRS
jgi:hypothetical protein